MILWVIRLGMGEKIHGENEYDSKLTVSPYCCCRKQWLTEISTYVKIKMNDRF